VALLVDSDFIGILVINISQCPSEQSADPALEGDTRVPGCRDGNLFSMCGSIRFVFDIEKHKLHGFALEQTRKAAFIPFLFPF
jgi:hypothetical protein